MIHFFLTFSNDAANSPFGRALVDMGVPHRVISRKVLLRYAGRYWLLLVGLPTLMLKALSAARESIAGPGPRPDAIVVNSHLEVLAFALIRTFFRHHCRLHLLGFIFTARPQAWLDRLRRAYLSFVFALTDSIICYSAHERVRYAKLFPGAAAKFVHIPYGLHIHGYEEQGWPFQDPAHSPALSAGRSGRDYPTLFKAFTACGHPLRVVCDWVQPLDGCAAATNIQVLRDCYDDAYSQELRRAGMVVVPLKATDISAGQMVAIQAMAFRKPIIVTQTPTIEEYLHHEQEALLVPEGDAQALMSAVERLRHDPELSRRLADAAHEAYVERHSMRAFVRNIIAVIDTQP